MIGTVLCSVAAVLISLDSIISSRAVKFTLHALACLSCYFFAVFLLSSDSSNNDRPSKTRTPDSSTESPRTRRTNLIRFTGILGTIYILLLQAIFPGSNPLAICAVRVTSFFYGCKLLDLTFTRASRPPVLFIDGSKADLTDWRQRIKYIWRLFAECRYFSFDIAVVEVGREQPANKAWTYAPQVMMPLLVLVFPSVETKCILGLLGISFGLELLHTILHPRCGRPLFWQPFAAISISSFWRTHWHQGASPWLFSLGYMPMKQIFTPIAGQNIGRAAGVLGTFSLSGIWHGWVASALTTRPWRTGIWMWAIFVAQGVACLLEQSIKKEWRGGIFHRSLVWTVSLILLASWIRDSREILRMPELARYI